MKIRICILFIFFISLHFISSAQNIRLQGGINLANVSTTSDGDVDDANKLTALQLGIVADIPLGSIFYLQPGILYTGKGSKVQSGEPGDNGYFKQSFSPSYLEIPLNLVLKTPTGKTRFFAGAGPYLAVGVGGKVRTDGTTIFGTTYNVERDIEFSDDDPTTLSEEEGAGFNIVRRFDYGLNGTAGVEGRSMILAVNYGWGLAKLQSGSNSQEDNNNKHRVLSFTLGFKL